MYQQLERGRIKADKLERALLCPASIFSPRSAEGSNPSSPNLFRWIAVRDAIIHWHGSTAEDPFEDAVNSVLAVLNEPCLVADARYPSKDSPPDTQSRPV